MALGNLIQLSREEALSVGPDKLASVLESPGRMARDVHGLLKLVSAVNAIQGLIWLERPLFELILDVIPADRGALVLTEGTESLPRLLAWNKDQGSQSLRICKQMTDRVLCEGLALSSNAVASQNDAAPRSVMAAPLIVFDRALGFVYLETTKSDIRFDAGHLHMLVIIAAIGATQQTRGKLEVAEGGSVFLDEIGELASPLQAKLLRVLQEHEVTRVGGTRAIKLNLRLIAATNRNLEDAVRQGVFRRDLYYRLNVVSKSMPPLRERRQDIPLLANHFIRKYAAKAGRRVLGISQQAEACLLNYDWPGNVRELENAIEHAIVLGSTDTVLAEDLPESVLEAMPSAGAPPSQFHAAVRDTKKQLICAAVAHAQGNYTRAAKYLGLQRSYLHRLIRNLGLHDAVKRSI